MHCGWMEPKTQTLLKMNSQFCSVTSHLPAVMKKNKWLSSLKLPTRQCDGLGVGVQCIDDIDDDGTRKKDTGVLVQCDVVVVGFQ